MKKKLLALVLCLAMVFSLAACTTGTTEPSGTPSASPEGTEATGGVSGTFTGSSAGMQGTITVEMTVENGVITNVELTECHETAGVSDVALERIPQQIVEHQTTTLDTVTGATFASRGIMMAAEKAAKMAMEHGLKKVSVFVKGPGSGRETAIRSLQAAGLEVASIQDCTPIPHNGCRQVKRRRV